MRVLGVREPPGEEGVVVELVPSYGRGLGAYCFVQCRRRRVLCQAAELVVVSA